MITGNDQVEPGNNSEIKGKKILEKQISLKIKNRDEV